MKASMAHYLVVVQPANLMRIEEQKRGECAYQRSAENTLRRSIAHESQVPQKFGGLRDEHRW